MRLTTKLIIGLLVNLTAFEASVQNIKFVPEKVIAAIRKVNPRLKIIVAHRGMYKAGCPENTECAVNEAAQFNIEAVEIDVKETRDGTPWPSHDINIGRGTTFNRNGIFFNPYHRSAANDANNPLISQMSDQDMRKLELRDHLGNVIHWKSVSLEDLLVVGKTKHKHIVYVFDIKYPQTVNKIARMVKRHGLDKQVVLKFSATFFPAISVNQHTMGLAFAPTLYAPQMDEIAGKYFLNEPSYNERVYRYMRDFGEVLGFTYFEIGNKMHKPFGSSVGVEGPMAALTNRLTQQLIPVGNFVPVIEHYADHRSPITGFFHTDGYCCTRLKDFLSHTRHFGSETRDDRTNLQRVLVFNENVITDDAILAKNEALERFSISLDHIRTM